jgi:hypothetical protein
VTNTEASKTKVTRNVKLSDKKEVTKANNTKVTKTKVNKLNNATPKVTQRRTRSQAK